MKYTISSLSRKTGLSIHTLRYYEKEGLVRHVERTKTGRRVYGEDSLGCLLGVICLKQAGMTLPQIKVFFDQTIQGADSLPKRIEMIKEAKEQLQARMNDLERGMQLVDFFINGATKALQAAHKGEDPDAAFPFLTRIGITEFPFMRDSEGKLEPTLPE